MCAALVPSAPIVTEKDQVAAGMARGSHSLKVGVWAR
jgi:hypothetical protein